MTEPKYIFVIRKGAINKEEAKKELDKLDIKYVLIVAENPKEDFQEMLLHDSQP